jgi:hypothetical protein
MDSIRALTELNGRAFAIGSAGPANYFFEVKRDGTFTNYGPALAGDTRPQMCPSQTQILILSGGLGYVFNLAANALSAISDPNFPIGAVKADYLDGYFIVLEPNCQTFAISNLNDGSSWNALDFGDAEGEPGNTVSMIVDHRQVWFLGENHGEIYYDSGNANFPLSRLDGAFFEQGCGAIDSVSKCDNTIFWLGRNRDGGHIVWRASGYAPQRVSVYAIENLIDSFGDCSDARAYAYQEGGHTFYRLDFPGANRGLGATLVYDVGEKEWHERTFWDAGLGVERADLARSHCYVWGQHLVGDYRSGNIYIQSNDYATDNGAAIRRLRSAPDLANGGNWSYYRELRLMAQAGVGLDGGVAPGSDPQIALQISNDGGFTWSSERMQSLGALGRYKNIVRWRQLGRSRNRAFRLICSEPVLAAIVAADLDAS